MSLRAFSRCLPLLLALACGGDRARPPDIVLISIDTLRADRLGTYGAERDTSPAMDALARAGVRFEEAIASAPWTLPSHVSLLTGLVPAEHRVTAPFHRIDPARQLLAEHLRDQGYRTAAVVSAPFLHRVYGFDRGFDDYQNFQGQREITVPPTRETHDDSHADRSADRVVDSALAWLKARGNTDEPWFLFVHVWDAHYDFQPPPPYDTLFDPDYAGDLDVTDFEQSDHIHADMDPRDLQHLVALYDGEIRWVDTQLARLFAALDARKRPLLVSLTADHGEEFFEHGKKGHMRALYEESVRVPWILRYPGVVAAGQAVRGAVALDDIAPTLLGLAQLPPMGEATGRDLAPALREGASTIDGTVVTMLGAKAALRGAGWKLIHDRANGLAVHYDLAADPAEQAPAPARKVARDEFDRLTERLDAAKRHADALTWERAGEEVELDAETRERLRRLGYIE